MSEWKEIRMENILESANTGLDAIKRAPIVEYDSGIKCLRIQDISQEKDFVNWGFCEVEPRNYERFQLRKGDIIIARTGATVGVNRFIKEELKSVYNNGLIRLRADNAKCLPEYLYYNLRTSYYNGYIEAISGGTSTQPNMQINALVDFEFLLPPLPEQRTIAGVLSSLDDKIDLLHRQNKTLEAMAETLFRQWFVEEADDGWKVDILGNIITIYDSKRIPVSSGEREKMKVGKLYPYYGAATIMDYVNDYIFDGEYILMGEDGTVQTTDGFPILQLPTGKFWVNNHAHIFQAKEPYTNFFIYIFLKQTNISGIVTGAVQPKINQEALKGIDFPIPPNEKINHFIEITNGFWNKIQSNTQQIRTLTKLRDTLLPKLMSGEVRVNTEL